MDPFAIISTSSTTDGWAHALKHGETFAVVGAHGDIGSGPGSEQGVFHEGTRHVSHRVLRLGTARPILLSSRVQSDNSVLTVDLTNAYTDDGSAPPLPHGSVHLMRSMLLWGSACHERFVLMNYTARPVTLLLHVEIDADFADIFEVRGTRRAARGRRLEPRYGASSMDLGYEGLDGVARGTRVDFSLPPTRLQEQRATFELTLLPRRENVLDVSYQFRHSDAPAPARITYDEALAASVAAVSSRAVELAAITTSNPAFNQWLTRSIADLRMMVTDTPEGPYPYAGVPWFSTAFGRDGIITALETLWIDPSLARGVLRFLAAHQARTTDVSRAAEPGKILHELRGGEMAALGEIPFGRYYGSVDATPLFVLLAGEYHQRTGDRALIQELWPAIERALEWIDRYGDADGDLLVEYRRYPAEGLVQQGWKDSHDSVFHADGRAAEPPIALCEVQAYTYAAKVHAARLADRLELPERATELRAQAAALQRRFEELFWCEELSTYALAVDGNKQPCRVRSSNAGHCLFGGIARPDRAARVARTLLADASFSGWGIRTIPSTEERFNPMSYHNGSVWPHDNALIALGLARYELKQMAIAILNGMFEATLTLGFRLPELFCGYPRRHGEGPTRYPVACSPQSWAAGSVFMMLQACLGLTIDAEKSQVRLSRPHLPPWLDEVRLPELRVGDGTVEMTLHRYAGDVGINVVRRDGPVQVVNVK